MLEGAKNTIIHVGYLDKYTFFFLQLMGVHARAGMQVHSKKPDITSQADSQAENR